MNRMPSFIRGLELNRRFYAEAVCPILDASFPNVPLAAALLGTGSDVLGFDDEMSTDHQWGLSLRLFLREEDAHLADEIREALRHRLPHAFQGYPVGTIPSADEPGIRIMHATAEGPVDRRVYIVTVRAFALRNLGYDVKQPLTAIDWLTFPSQRLRELTSGAVYHDGVGELTALRERLTWYPHDVWLYLLAAGWHRIAQEEHLMPRAGFVADELGSAIIGSRLVRDIMNLLFLMERQYAPYAKWFGTAFRQLECAADLTPILWRAQTVSTWQAREAALGEAYEYLASAHNALGITEALPTKVSNFYDRPFQVIQGNRFMEAIAARITDPNIRRIASEHPIGNIDQWSDNTDLRSNVEYRPAALGLYRNQE